MAIAPPTSQRATVAALLTLTVVTGLIDAVSYLRLGRVFVANMTGNVVFLGFSLAPRSGLSPVASIIAIAGFLLGAHLGGRIAGRLDPRPRRWLMTAFGTEAALLAVVAVLVGSGVLPVAAHGQYVTIAVLAAGLGVQNSTVRHLAVPDLTTTVLTLTLTGLAADRAPGARRGSYRRLASVLAMLAGAAAGAGLVRVSATAAIAIAAALAAAVTLAFGHVRSPAASGKAGKGMLMSDTVAILGAGALGAAIAARLADTGHPVRLWNRTADKARAVASGTPGVTAVENLDDTVLGASVVLTVLRDAAAVADVMASALGSLDTDTVWVQVSTVGPAGANELADLARSRGVAYLDAPVSGSTAPARSGTLVWLVAGDQGAFDRAMPVLNDLGSSVEHVGAGVEGSSLKLAVNAWMTAATVAMSDVLGLCDALGVGHEQFAQALSAGPLAMPYALQKASAMDERAYDPGFAVQLALKDLDLAADVRPASPLLAAVRERLADTAAAGHSDDDLAAVDFARTDP